MMGISSGELLFLAILALLLIPTSDIPKLLRLAGKGWARLETLKESFTNQINRIHEAPSPQDDATQPPDKP